MARDGIKASVQEVAREALESVSSHPRSSQRGRTASKHPWFATSLETLSNQGTGSRPDSISVCTTLETPLLRDYLEPLRTPRSRPARNLD